MDRFLARPGVPVSDDPSSSRPTKRPLPPGTQTRLRDCAKVVVLDRRDDPAQAAAALLPTLTDGAASPAAQLDALRRLACLRFVDRGLLASTGVGAAVRRLKRSDDVEVGQVRRGERGREEGRGGEGGRGEVDGSGPGPFTLSLSHLLTHNISVRRPPGGKVEGPRPGRAGPGPAGGGAAGGVRKERNPPSPLCLNREGGAAVFFSPFVRAPPLVRKPPPLDHMCR